MKSVSQSACCALSRSRGSEILFATDTNGDASLSTQSLTHRLSWQPTDGISPIGLTKDRVRQLGASTMEQSNFVQLDNNAQLPSVASSQRGSALFNDR
jgi:hypothetical protein